MLGNELMKTLGTTMAQVNMLAFILANERAPTIAEMDALQSDTIKFVRDAVPDPNSAEPVEWRYLRRALVLCLSYCQNRLTSVP